MRCANATAMDRSRRDESSATSIVQIGRGVTELWPFKVFPAVCLFAERLDGPIVRGKAGIFTCARVRRTGRLRGFCEAEYLRGPASDQLDAGTAGTVSAPASR